MEYAPFVDRIKSLGSDAWDIHFKAVEAVKQGKDVIVLSVGDPDFKTPDIICEAATAAINAGDTHYTEICGYPELRQEIANKHNIVANVPVKEKPITQEHVIIVPGAQNGLYCTATCLLSAGDEAIVLDPAYLTYEATLKASGATVVKVPTLTDSYFRLDPVALRQAVTSKTKAIFFANPNNPTGRMMDLDELEEIAAIAREFDLWVVSDEVYSGLAFEKTHQNIQSLEGMSERTVVLGSLSKSHAMTGWRIGWVIANPTLIKHIGQIVLNMFYGLPGFIQQAGIVALQNYDAISQEMNKVYQHRCALVLNQLQDCPLIKLIKPDSGMFLLLDIRAMDISTKEFTWGLFDNYGVSLLDAEAFGSATKGFVRLSFSVSEEQLTEACKRIKRFVTELTVNTQ